MWAAISLAASIEWGVYMRKINIMTAILFIIFGIVIIMGTSNFKQTVLSDNFIGPAFFPKFMAIGMIVCAIILIINTLLDKKSQEISVGEIFNKKMFLPIIGMIILFIYVITLDYLGFLLATILLNLILLLLFKVRKKSILILAPVLTTLVIYQVFQKFLMVPLPPGLFSF